jgi:radical SAM superfamily enzyme YgiQ (UPF0313 family)
MRIYLVNPAFPLSLWDFSGCRDIDGSAFPFPPLSLATLAALTPGGHEVVIGDENVRPVDLDFEADVVGITGYSIQKERVYELADAFRKRGIAVAVGGPLVRKATLDECAAHADAVFLGEAEYTWPLFIRDCETKSVQALYVQESLVDLSDSPLPRFDLLELASYSSAIIETSRGCPHSCEFCEIPIRLGKGPRTKSPEQAMAEIRELYRLGCDSIFIIDDNFFGNRKRALALLFEIRDFVISVDYRVYFSCQFTIDIARDESVLSLLREANVRRVFIGLETSRESSLKTAGKRQNTGLDLLEAVHMILSHNIIVWGAFIVGFDNDDAKVFDEQFRFIQAAAIPVAMVGILQALPGTPLYERMVKEGRLKNNEAGGIRGSFNHLISTNITPLNMTDGDLAQGYRSLVARLYSYDNFAERIINAVKRGKHQEPRGRKRIRKKEFLILLRLLRYYLLSADTRRTRMFFRIIIKTLMHAPRRLETVLMHLVVYKHLSMFYEQA